jgi:hypothetical protein
MHEIMKQKIYISGVVTALVVFAGTIFKVNHWPAAGILITAGLVILVLGFLPLALIDHYKAEGNRQNLLLHVITWLTCFVVFTALLFKVQHWPFAGILLTFALPFPYVVFLPVFLITTSKNKNFNIYNTVFVLMLLALNSVFSALLALNVSKTRIDDSYNISGHYNKVEKVLNQLPLNDTKSPVCLKIDEALNVVNEYKNLIMNFEGISKEEWENNPGNLRRPESRQVTTHALQDAGNDRVGEKLDNSLRALIREIKNTPGYEELAKAVPAILGLEMQGEREPSWVYHNLTNTLSWTVIYLDGLETNLKLIKASVD